MEDNRTFKIAKTRDYIDINDKKITDENINAADDPNAQLELFLAEIDAYCDRFLCCSKSSLQFGENIYELDSTLNNELEFSINKDVLNSHLEKKSIFYSHVASSEQACYHTLSDLPKSDKFDCIFNTSTRR